MPHLIFWGRGRGGARGKFLNNLKFFKVKRKEYLILERSKRWTAI